MSLIQTIDVIKKYPTITVAIPNLKITNRVTLIKGPNGSGKSTLLKALMGWIRYEGTIHINGTVSYMPELHTFPKDISVRTFLQSLSNNMKTIHHHLKLCHMEHKIDASIDSLSKGMKAKLNMIQCLINDCDIYLLDEPFSGLDVDSVQIIVDYIKRSTKTFLITTHIQAINLGGDVITFD